MDDSRSDSCISYQSLAFHFVALLGAAALVAGCAALATQQPVGFAPTDLPSVPQRIVVTPTAVTTPTQLPTATQLPAVTPTSTPTPPFAEGPFPIGYSVQGRPILAYRFGHGPGARALIGGLHGGYEWNTVTLMTQTVEHLTAHPQLIPPHLTLYIIPVANPDGLAAGTESTQGRLNAQRVDLNRNWDYHWQMTATHGLQPVSAGAFAFSEPETRALRDFILEREIRATIFYHSALAKVFSGAGITTSHTVDLAGVMANATGYAYAPEGVPGQITTGNAIDWLTANGITAVEVELTNHQDLDWEQNLRGLRAFLNWNLPRRQAMTVRGGAASPGAPPFRRILFYDPHVLSVFGRNNNVRSSQVEQDRIAVTRLETVSNLAVYESIQPGTGLKETEYEQQSYLTGLDCGWRTMATTPCRRLTPPPVSQLRRSRSETGQLRWPSTCFAHAYGLPTTSTTRCKRLTR